MNKIKILPSPSKNYSEAAIFGDLVFVAGQASMNPETGEAIPGTIEEETRRALENMKAILEQSGSSLSSVLKVLVMIESLDNFDRMNAVYREYFPQNPPPRSTVETKLPGGVQVEFECVAAREREVA